MNKRAGLLTDKLEEGVCQTMQKKRHHFVAKTYLKGFCNERGKICAYSKDNPAYYWWAAPETVGFEKYYYSQPTPDSGQDNNRIEDFFSSIESEWPLLLSKIKRAEHHPGGLDQLLRFAIVHRVRVPTMRNAAELMRAESVRMFTRTLNDRGQLPPLPSGFTFDYLDQHTEISIDPHQSIHAMAAFAKGMETLIEYLSFEILENQTTLGFITSDNPVIYFDPSIHLNSMQPYNINPERMNIEFMFPLTPRHMLWGHSGLKPKGRRHECYYRTLTDQQFVKRANVLAARFAHRMVFSDTAHHQPLVKKYCAASPVLSVDHFKTERGRGLIGQLIFGKRESKPKWRGSGV